MAKNLKKYKLYFAYGMNTNKSEMAYRCLDAKDLGKAMLPGYAFAFNTHATVMPDIMSETYGVLWEISDADEFMLDVLEGFPTYYRKETVDVIHQGKTVTAMTYVMNKPGESAPPDSYYQMVSQGYKQHGISKRQLKEALERTQEVAYYEDFMYNIGYGQHYDY